MFPRIKLKVIKRKEKNNLFNLIKQQLIFFKKQFLKFGNIIIENP